MPSGTRVRDPPALIFVEGEEDLAVLPLVLAAPLGVIILYGQPKEGVVLREVDAQAKALAAAFVDRFVHEGNPHCTRERPHPLNKFGADVWRIPMTPMAHLQITNDREETQLLKRRELSFTLGCPGSSPSRSEVMGKVCAILNLDEKKVVLDSVKTPVRREEDARHRPRV